MNEVRDFIESWAGGVITTLEEDSIPKDASPRGWNSVLTSLGGGRGAVEKRRGITTRNRTAITGAPAIIGIAQFKHIASGVKTLYDILVSDSGRVERLESDDSLTNITTGLSGTEAPDFAQAQNMLFLMNGSFKKKLLVVGGNLTLQDHGIPRPDAPTLTQPNAGGMTGDFDIAITEVNEDAVLNESSLSDTATITVSGKKITITPGTLSSQTTHWRVYIRKSGLSSVFKRNTFSSTGYDSTVQGWTAATSSIEIDLSDTQLGQLTIGAPSTSQNEPPPDGIKLAVWHNNRLFVADDENVYYSNDGFPEAFNTDSVEPINPKDGRRIRGLVSVGSGEQSTLVVIKEEGVWGLIGDDPKTWIKTQLIPGLGGSSHRSIVVDPNGVIHWWSPQIGPVAWVPGSAPVDIGKTLVEKTINDEAVNYGQANNVVASLFGQQNLILFGVAEKEPEGEPNSTKNNIILPYNYKEKRWVASRWNPIDVASMAVLEDANGNNKVHLGGYFGQVFRLWDADNDGVVEGTISGSVTSATSSTLTDASATFDTTGAGLTGRYLYVKDPSGNLQRRRIGSNTGTVLTLDSGLTFSVTPNSNYTYFIGGIQWEWDLYWSLFDAPFRKKRLAFGYMQFKTPAASTKVTVDVFTNYNTSPTKSIELLVNPGGGVWDSAIWDQSRWASEAAQNFRKRLGLTAIAVKLRFRNANPDEPLVLLKAGYRGELLSDKIG